MGNIPFDESALAIAPSPPPSHGSNSASSAVESKFLRRVRILQYVRLGLCAISIALSTAVIACEGHALHVYDSTHLNSEWWLPLWPQYFDLRPSVTLLVGSAIVLVASLTYVVISLIPSPHSRTTLLNLAFASTTFLSLFSSLFSLAYVTHLHHVNSLPHVSRDSLGTWTCRWAHGASGTAAPKGFGKICQETKAAWGIVVALVVLQAFVCGVVVLAGWWFGFGVWRERRRSEKGGEGWVMEGVEGHGEAREVSRD